MDAYNTTNKSQSLKMLVKILSKYNFAFFCIKYLYFCILKNFIFSHDIKKIIRIYIFNNTNKQFIQRERKEEENLPKIYVCKILKTIAA